MYVGLLEDNVDVCEYMTMVLKLAGHTVDAHTTGLSLLETLASSSEPYNMVIVDLNLPGSISGHEVVKSIRSNNFMSHLPILMVSGSGEYELRHFRAAFPSIPILRKPFKLQTLLQYINQCCYVS